MSRAIKCVMVGDSQIGKTSLVSAYFTNTFKEAYVPTIFENYNLNAILDNVSVDFAIWDSSGSAEFDSMRPVSYPHTDVFLLCFAVNDPDSLSNIIAKWIPEINEHAPEAPKLLIGTKVDLRAVSDTEDGDLTMHDLGTITHRQGEALAQQIGALAFLECSASSRAGLADIFTTVSQIVKYGPKKAHIKRANSNGVSATTPRHHSTKRSKKQNEQRDKIPQEFRLDLTKISSTSSGEMDTSSSTNTVSYSEYKRHKRSESKKDLRSAKADGESIDEIRRGSFIGFLTTTPRNSPAKSPRQVHASKSLPRSGGSPTLLRDNKSPMDLSNRSLDDLMASQKRKGGSRIRADTDPILSCSDLSTRKFESEVPMPMSARDTRDMKSKAKRSREKQLHHSNSRAKKEKCIIA